MTCSIFIFILLLSQLLAGHAAMLEEVPIKAKLRNFLEQQSRLESDNPLASLEEIAASPRVVIKPEALGQADGWYTVDYYEKGHCDGTVMNGFGYPTGTCLLLFADDRTVTGSVYYSCDDGTVTITTYSDGDCQNQSEQRDRPVNSCVDNDDDYFDVFSIKPQCTSSTDLPVPNKGDFAVYTGYNDTSCSSESEITSIRYYQTGECIDFGAFSMHIDKNLKVDVYSDDDCDDFQYDQALPSSCAESDDDNFDTNDDIDVDGEYDAAGEWSYSKGKDSDDDDDEDGLTAGAIAGIVIGTVAGVALIVAFVYYFMFGRYTASGPMSSQAELV